MTSNASRLFVDLVYSGTSKWANWEPPLMVEVGDFGTVDKKTGAFERSGNIYEDLKDQINLEMYKPIETPVENDFLFTSSTVKRIDVGGGPTAQLAGIAEVSFEGQYMFGRDRGALLAMAKPRLKALPNKFPYDKLVDIKQMANKGLVTNVSICPAFALYLSQANEDSVTLTADVSAPLPNVPGVELGAKAHTNWTFKRFSGFPRSASNKEYVFTPIYSLKLIEPRSFRQRLLRTRGQHVDPPTGVDALPDYPLPWDTLDNNGVEIPTDI